MFGVYRYFAIGSAAAMLAAMFGLGIAYHRSELQNLVQITENSNVVLAKSLSAIVFSQSWPVDDTAPPDNIHQLSRTRRLEAFLGAATEQSGVLKIKIYDVDGETLFSSDAGEIGENRFERDHGSAFLETAQKARPHSELSYKDHISAFSGELFNRDIVETYVPIPDGSGNVAGVFEVYTDVTDMVDRIDHLLPFALLILFGVFISLYGILVFFVFRRAIAPIRLASQRAAAIGPQSSGVRLPVSGMPAEIAPLIDAVNRALSRLDAALEAQRQFTADAAHELLTPLAVLQANLDTMDEEVSDSLKRDVTVMSEIVQRLFDLAQMDTLEPGASEAVDLKEICVEVAAMLVPLAYSERKHIEFVDSGADVQARCNRTALSRAIRNLVENAVSFTPPGTTVEVKLGNDGSISVKDQGPGVPPDMREIIFQRFKRIGHEDRPGAGLGLAIVKRFADTYGGSIEVENAPNGGAIFTLRLPTA